VPTPQVTVADAAQATEVVEGMARVRAELGVADRFPADVLAAAEAAARSTARTSDRPDRTDIALVTIDPPGSRDLDQAYGAERRPDRGYRIWYAIADVAAFVDPGGSLDAECHGRGVTLYGPDRREPLHPPVLGEGAASLLPDGDRPALLWCIDLDGDATPVATRLERAIVAGGYPAFVRSLDPTSPTGAALLVQAARALRGAGYVGFVGGAVPTDPVHGAVAAPYAHVTAPLRRLCDRAANEVVLSLLAGQPAPEWAVAELALLPGVMGEADSRAGAFSRAALDLVEALVLAPSVGERFAATVVDVDHDKAEVQLRDPAVVARARNGRDCEPGDEVEVVLRAADPLDRRVDLDVV
jgi:exoribonuclease R